MMPPGFHGIQLPMFTADILTHIIQSLQTENIDELEKLIGHIPRYDKTIGDKVLLIVATIKADLPGNNNVIQRLLVLAFGILQLCNQYPPREDAYRAAKVALLVFDCIRTSHEGKYLLHLDRMPKAIILFIGQECEKEQTDAFCLGLTTPYSKSFSDIRFDSIFKYVMHGFVVDEVRYMQSVKQCYKLLFGQLPPDNVNTKKSLLHFIDSKPDSTRNSDKGKLFEIVIIPSRSNAEMTGWSHLQMFLVGIIKIQRKDMTIEDVRRLSLFMLDAFYNHETGFNFVAMSNFYKEQKGNPLSTIYDFV